MGPLYSRVRGTREFCKEDSIVVTIDGDDELILPSSLSLLADEFDKGGQVVYAKTQIHDKVIGEDYPSIIKEQNSYREHPWLCAPPRCFWSGMLRHIDEEYFLHNGTWIEAATDMALFFPLMELANGKVNFVDKVLYHYYWNKNNSSNPENQKFYEEIVRKTPKIQSKLFI
jgi:hypothetical protein